MDLPISNVTNVSIALAGTGVGKYNTSNVALFTEEVPILSFGTDLFKIFLEPSEVAKYFGTTSKTYKMSLALFGQQPNILNNGGYLVVIPMLLDGGVLDETLGEAVNRTMGLVQYFGIMSTLLAPIEATLLADAAVVQTLNKMAFTVSKTVADVDAAGLLDKLRSGGLYRTRGLLHPVANDIDALIMMASYVGRALSVNFTGSKTTMSMHLKDLSSVQPAPIDQTLLNKCKAAGVDVYCSIQGVAKVFCTQGNRFFDRVYNMSAYIGDLQIAIFNVLATVGTKVSQTEQGVDILKSSVRDVCEQYVNNEFFAAGKWTDPTTFGNQKDFFDNISQRGYYIYSGPVAQQAQADREARHAPLIQVAGKEAGAIHDSNLIINLNA